MRQIATLVGSILIALNSFAQTPTVQDCDGAIPVCQNVYSEANSYSGTGNYPTEVNSLNSCLGGAGEVNSVWYTFTAQTNGNVCFDITPNVSADDYDWAVYDLTNNSCADIYNNAALEVSCNFSGVSGVTGPNGQAGAQNEPCIPVTAGNTYSVLVNNWSGSTNGYTLDFGASTATIFDNVPPAIDQVQTPIPCGATTIDFSFSEAILCNTLTTGDLVLNGPGGPYTITGVSGAVCAAGGNQEDQFTITITPPITIAGNYSLDLVGGSGFVTDLCGNTAAAGSLPFTVTNTIGYNVTIVDETCISSDDGSITITGNGGTAPYTYDLLTGPSAPQTNGTGVFDPLIDGTYDVVVTDANGCSNQVTVTVNAGLVSCCAADAGTTNQSITGNAQNNYILCDGDELFINSNNDFTNAPGGTSPGIQYAIYICPPNPAINDPNLDPCYSGYFASSFSPNMSTLNGGGSAGGYIAALNGVGVTVTNNTLWFVPITCIETSPNVITIDPNCVDAGPAVEVTYLEPITWNATENCATNSWDVTVFGGYPELYGGNFTISNVQPANATVTPGTVAHGGSVSVTGLAFGDIFSFDVTDANGCTQTITAGPYTCCPADAGTASATINGFGTNNYILCDGDEIVLTTNNDYTNSPGVAPGITYGIYTCPPTPGIDPALDPCYSGFVTGQIFTSTDINQGGSAGGLLGALIGAGVPIVGNTIYYAPFTLIDTVGLFYDPNCFSVGPAIPVTYLEPITYTATENCATQSWDITVTGGYASMFGGNFTISNLVVTPANGNAALSTTSITDGGTVSVTGLNYGDTFTFTVTDDNGCPITVNGGPYTCCPADAGTATGTLIGSGQTNFVLCDGDAISIVGDGNHINSPGVAPGITFGIYTCPPTPGIDPATDPCYSGFVTGTIGSMIDVNQGGSAGGLLGALIGAGVPVVGNTLYFAPFTLIDTVGLFYDPNCFDVGPPIMVQYLEPLVANATATDATCGNPDGTVTITGTGGTGVFTYELVGVGTNGTGSFTNLTANTYNAVVHDDNGCSDTIPITVNNFGAPTINGVTFTDPTCNQACDGTITVNATGGTAPLNYDIGGAQQTSNVFTGVCAGTYTITVTDANGCIATDQVTLTDPPVVSFTTTQVDLTCYQDGTGEITITAQGGSGNFEYSIDNGVTFLPTNVFSNLAAGTYDIVVQDIPGNCQATGQVIITEPTELTFQFSAFDATCNGICDGYAIVIPQGGTVVGGYTYNWSNGIAGPTSAQASNLCAGTYSLTVLDDNGCSVDTTFVISAPAAVTIDNVVSSNVSCNGACDGDITVTAPLAIEFAIDNGGGIGPYGPTNSWTNLCAGTYTIYARNANQCTEDTTITITEPAAMTITASNDTTICINGTATLSAQATGGDGNYTYIWDNGLPAQQTVTANPAVNTTYCVTAIDGNGCQTPQECVDVSLLQPLTLVVSNDTAVCPGETVTLVANASGGDGNYTIDWNNGQGSGNTFTVTPGVTTVYTITVTDGCNTPSAQEQVTVTIHPTPVPQFTVDPPNGCAPLDVTLTNTSDPNIVGGNCQWLIDGQVVSTDCSSYNNIFTVPGDYDVTLEFTSPDGCFGTTTVNDAINVYGLPTADFTWGPNPTNYLNSEIHFSNLSSNASTYYWEFDTVGTSVETDPSFEFPDTSAGTYDVCLWAYTQYGCVDSICDVITIDGVYSFYVPNAFTPDGDGLNDFFYPRGNGFDNSDYTLYIFDRWGELIFESYNVDNWWDGTVKGTSEMAKTDVYVWKIVVKNNFSGEKKDYVGHVTLLR